MPSLFTIILSPARLPLMVPLWSASHACPLRWLQRLISVPVSQVHGHFRRLRLRSVRKQQVDRWAAVASHAVVLVLLALQPLLPLLDLKLASCG